jgi:hypothetical protein
LDQNPLQPVPVKGLARRTRPGTEALPAAAATDEQRQAQALDKRLIGLRSGMRRRWLELGGVLREIQETLAYRILGFSNFQHYVRQRLDISPRWAMYLVNLTRKIEEYRVDRERVCRLEISKCMEIFRLDDPVRAGELVEETIAAKLSLQEVHERGQRALGIRPISSGDVVRKLWSFSLEQWGVIERAIQYVRRGGPVSDTYALELICADYLAGVQTDELQQGA